MDITWLGYSAMRLRTRNATVVIDPTDKSAGVDMARPTGDIVLISRDHIHHNFVSGVKGTPFVIDGPGEYEVGGVILGLPLSLDGNENERTKKVRFFAKELEKKIKVTFYDERFSTDVIFKELRKNYISSNKIKKKIDQLSASYILQGFLDNIKNSLR